MNLKSAYHLPATVKDLDIKQGIITGFASAFDIKDSDGDIMMPGCFAKTIKEQGPGSAQPRIKHLLNHRPDQPIANPLVLEEKSFGLYYESKAGSHNLGVDFLKMVDSGLITEHSIGFKTIKEQFSKEKNANLIRETHLMEFSSLTAWGANQHTPLVGIKAIKSVDERIEKLKSAIHNGTFTDGGFEFLIEELNFLQKAYKDATTKPGAAATTSPERWSAWFN